MPKRLVILVGQETDDGPGPLGSSRAVLDQLSQFNCAPDGTGPDGLGRTPGMATLYGPGLMMEFPVGSDELNQVMVTLTDDDFAFPVVMRLCRTAGWLMMDPESGRTFGG